MKNGILKRIEEIEKRARKISSDVPDLIMIFFRDDMKKWIVQKSFSGEKSGCCRQTVEEYEGLKEYVLPEGFAGVCINGRI